MCVEQIYVRKVKLFLTYIPNISSEIVDFQENGGVGDIQTQIPFFPTLDWDSCIVQWSNNHLRSILLSDQ